MSYQLAIIGTKDNPIYEYTFGTFKQENRGQHHFNKDQLEILPFVINSSIDLIEDQQWNSNLNYLKNYDSSQGFKLNCYLTLGNIKIILLYDLKDTNLKNDENLKQFLVEVNELYLKHSLSPFYQVNDTIKSQAFHSRIALSLKKYL